MRTREVSFTGTDRMSDLFAVHEGLTPLLISVPHDGRFLPGKIKKRMTTVGRDIPDTDWHVARLYDFAAELGASIVLASHSRFVVDLNRPPDDAALYEGQVATGICPQQSFAGDELYISGETPSAEETEERVRTYWQPYHDFIDTRLSALREEHGYALLWDAHSIPSQVPRLFDGELPALNIGTNDNASCAASIAEDVIDVAISSGFSSVANGRFKGGYITRHYGNPDNDVHAIQLEIAQRAYMNEESREFDEALAAKLCDTLRSIIAILMDSAGRRYQ